jgi:hypothetical protein
MILMIRDHLNSTFEAHILYRRLSKLLHEQWLLNFVLYLKHNNAFMWNWSKSVLTDNSFFIAWYNEIYWCKVEEKTTLVSSICVLGSLTKPWSRSINLKMMKHVSLPSSMFRKKWSILWITLLLLTTKAFSPTLTLTT